MTHQDVPYPEGFKPEDMAKKDCPHCAGTGIELRQDGPDDVTEELCPCTQVEPDADDATEIPF